MGSDPGQDRPAPLPQAPLPPQPPQQHTTSGGSWANALYAYIDHPEQHAAAIVRRDSLVTVIRDKYPKARVHFLVLANSKIPHLGALTAAHLPLLAHMQTCAAALIAKYVRAGFFG